MPHPIWTLACPPELPSIAFVMYGPTAGFALREPLLAWLKARENEMADLLAELVAIPTENPPGRHYQTCADLLEKRLREAGLSCERHEFALPLANANAQTSNHNESVEERPASLLATYGRGKRTLHFHGHY